MPFQRSRQYAHQSYGGGEGDPKGEKPQDQGSNPSADLEHPGPPPPSEGQGTGGGPTKAHESGHNTQDNSSSRGRGSESPKSGNTGSSSKGAQPKILNEAVPDNPSDDVKQHNEDMAKRYDRTENNAEDQEKDKVGKGFWSGKKMTFVWDPVENCLFNYEIGSGGVDRDP